jgi:hypothetical protein
LRRRPFSHEDEFEMSDNPVDNFMIFYERKICLDIVLEYFLKYPSNVRSKKIGLGKESQDHQHQNPSVQQISQS